MPVIIVKIAFFVFQATKIETIPAKNLPLARFRLSVPSRTSNSGKIIADNTAGGTKRSARCMMFGTENLPHETMNDNLIANVIIPAAIKTIQVFISDAPSKDLYRFLLTQPGLNLVYKEDYMRKRPQHSR